MNMLVAVRRTRTCFSGGGIVSELKLTLDLRFRHCWQATAVIFDRLNRLP